MRDIPLRLVIRLLMVLESRQDFAGALIPLSIEIGLLLDLLNLTVDTAESNHIHLLTRYARGVNRQNLPACNPMRVQSILLFQFADRV